MSSPSSRWAIVDDLDSHIEYAGEWRQKSSQDFALLGNFGQPFGTTLHAMSAGTSSLSFKFNGTDGAVLGTSANAEVGALVDPHWDCFLDGINIPSTNATLNPRNNQKFCEWTNTPLGEHTILVNITSVNYPFHFDQILYAPSPSHISSGDELVSINYVDPIFKFDSSWKEANSMGMMTGEKGASLTVAFSGTSFLWYGMGLAAYPQASSNGTYQVDGGEPVTFVLADLGPSGIPNPRFNELMFDVQNLRPEAHSIYVAYDGDSTVRPLTLTSIVVQSQHEAVIPKTGPTSKAVPLSAIIGAVLGGFFFILAIILALFWYLYNRKRPHHHVQKGMRKEIDPFYVDLSTYKIPSDFNSDEFEPLTRSRASRNSSMVGLDMHLIDPFAIPERPSTPPRRPHSRYSRDLNPPSRTPSFDILLSAPPPNVRSSGIVAVRLRSDSFS